MINTDVGVLDKVMTILEYFKVNPTNCYTPKEIASFTGYNFSTTYRLMKSMEAHDMLSFDGKSFSLGSLFSNLGIVRNAGIDNLPIIARPFMVRLNMEIDENIHLVTRYQNFRCIVECIPSSKPIRPIATIGEPLPLYKGATGNVLMAFLYNDHMALDLISSSANYFDKQLDKKELSDIHQELHKTREQGYSLTIGGRIAEITSIAAPIFQKDGNIAAALAVVVPNAQIASGDSIIKYKQKLLLNAQEISNLLT